MFQLTNSLFSKRSAIVESSSSCLIIVTNKLLATLPPHPPGLLSNVEHKWAWGTHVIKIDFCTPGAAVSQWRWLLWCTSLLPATSQKCLSDFVSQCNDNTTGCNTSLNKQNRTGFLGPACALICWLTAERQHCLFNVGRVKGRCIAFVRSAVEVTLSSGPSCCRQLGHATYIESNYPCQLITALLVPSHSTRARMHTHTHIHTHILDLCQVFRTQKSRVKTQPAKQQSRTINFRSIPDSSQCKSLTVIHMFHIYSHPEFILCVRKGWHISCATLVQNCTHR